MIIKAPRTP